MCFVIKGILFFVLFPLFCFSQNIDGFSVFKINSRSGQIIDYFLNHEMYFPLIQKIDGYKIEDEYLDHYEGKIKDNILYELIPSKKKISSYSDDKIKFYESELFRNKLKKYYIKTFIKDKYRLKNIVLVFYNDSLKIIKCQEFGIGIEFSKEVLGNFIDQKKIDSIFLKSNSSSYDFHNIIKEKYGKKDSSRIVFYNDTCTQTITRDVDQTDFWFGEKSNTTLYIRKYIYSDLECKIKILNRIECYDNDFYYRYITTKGM